MGLHDQLGQENGFQAPISTLFKRVLILVVKAVESRAARSL
jgi:hypothetical protein